MCLTTLSVVPFRFVEAQHQGSITINADGSITPSTVPIQRNGNLYTLTGDLTGNLSVLSSNVIFDGDGHAIQGEIGGISLKNVENVTVKNLVVEGGQYGIDLSECSYTTVFNNTITETSFFIAGEGLGGISVRGGTRNTIVGNRLEDNFYGMYLTVANSTIAENTIASNSVGVYLMDSVNNSFYHNNFINNDMNVMYRSQLSSRLLNIWDGGFSSGGNYWSDYSGPDANNDGIGGSPYMIDNNNQDRFPLMKPWAPDVAPQRISISSPENITYKARSVPLNFSVDKPYSYFSYSLDGQNNVTISGNTTLTELTNGNHNLTIYATDETGNAGTYETLFFTVDSPEVFPVLPVAAVVGVAIIAVASGLLVMRRKRQKEAQQT